LFSSRSGGASADVEALIEMAVDALKLFIDDSRNGQTCRGVPAPAERSLAGDVDLSAVAKRKRKQHHWSTFNRVQPSFRLISTSNNSVHQYQLANLIRIHTQEVTGSIPVSDILRAGPAGTPGPGQEKRTKTNRLTAFDNRRIRPNWSSRLIHGGD
jgi:hypothetical protein